jgi:hypothetical protein
VQVADDGRRLRWPDYPGNGFFNTLGNLTLDPRAGLVFVDFAAGTLLHVAGRATIIWNEVARDTTAPLRAERWIDLEIDAVRLRRHALPLRGRRLDAA